MDFEHLSQPFAKKPRAIRLTIYFGSVILTAACLHAVFNQPGPVISPLPEVLRPTPKKMNVLDFFKSKKNPENLKEAIGRAVNGEWKNYSVYIEDYDNDFTYGINESVIYTAASINKVAILAALYANAQKGTVDLDERITVQEGDIQNFGTGSIRYDPPGTVYSIKTLAKLMMQQSDNTAAYILGNYVLGLDKIQVLLEEWGLTQTDMVNNKTSNHDLSILFKRIYSGNVANQASTAEMLAFMKDSDFEDRLPALLPKTAKVYHKIGTEQGILHDAGIIQSGVRTYYVGVLTSDTPDEIETTKTMAKLSKAIFEYMIP